MHDGFSGGAFLDTDGRLIGIATAARIRGLGVVIPAAITLGAVTMVLEHGRPRRGYLGVAGQPVTLPEAQRPAAAGRDSALVVVNVQRESPAEAAGMLIGDVLVDFDGHAVESPDDLLDLLVGSRVGASVPVRILRGGQAMTLTVVVGERPPR
jgi:S1-C subfamily serine protease